MTKAGEKVRWIAVNGETTGTVVGPFILKGKAAGWYVRLDSGKEVVVNESSFIKQ